MNAASKYVEKKSRCWKCGKEIAVYTWPGHHLWAQSSPDQGRPSTVQFMKSKVAQDGYWANRCSHCGVIQGDWFLYCEAEGAFFDPGRMYDVFR